MSVKKTRNVYIDHHMRTCYSHSRLDAKNTKSDGELLQMLVKNQLLYLLYRKDEKEKVESVLKKEIANWYYSGSIHMPSGSKINSNCSYINPTLMRPNSNQWCLFCSLIPFTSFLLPEKFDLQNNSFVHF